MRHIWIDWIDTRIKLKTIIAAMLGFLGWQTAKASPIPLGITPVSPYPHRDAMVQAYLNEGYKVQGKSDDTVELMSARWYVRVEPDGRTVEYQRTA